MSIYLPDHDTYFMHIPKTGGTWRDDVLKHLQLKCVPYTVEKASVQHALLEQLRSRPKHVFTFVRHPITWYESWWSFQCDHKWLKWEKAPGYWHPLRSLDICEDYAFNAFVAKCIKYEPAFVTRMYEWYIGPPGVCRVDRVGLFENLRSHFADMLSQVGITFDPAVMMEYKPVRTATLRKGRPTWDAALYAKILELEAPAIRRFYPNPVMGGCNGREDESCPAG